MKLRALLGTVAVLSSLMVATFVAPASAAAGCVDIPIVYRQAGDDVYDPNNHLFGVQAAIDPPEGTSMMHCTGGNGVANNSVSAWVAMTPENGNANTILQVGIIRCDDPFYSACDGSGYRFFWAVGGCEVPGTPSPINIGVADTGSHTYSIFRDVSGGAVIYRIRIDAGATYNGYIHATDSRLNCWIDGSDGYLSTMFRGETWDGGDKYGTGSEHLLFRNAKYFVNDNWYTVNFGSTCGATDSTVYDHGCNVLDATPDRFELYSYLD